MRQLFTQTSKEFIKDLPRYAYDGRIVVINSEGEAERACQALATAPILGIDTETRPAFHKGDEHKVALVQVAMGEEVCFLFRINETGFVPCLKDLLSNPDVLKIGLSLSDDFLMLRKRDADFTPAGYIDLQSYVKPLGIRDMSLMKLYANVFHQRISKSARLSNWEADVLSESQRVYAATDAVTCVQLYKELENLRVTKAYELVETQPVPPVEAQPRPKTDEAGVEGTKPKARKRTYRRRTRS